MVLILSTKVCQLHAWPWTASLSHDLYVTVLHQLVEDEHPVWRDLF